MKRIQKVLLLGSGALKIGEAGEFDYSGTQAIKALKEEGKEVILVNPNIATVQTSAGLADRIYFLPVTPNVVEKIIAKEKPDAILLSFGGQTALNCGIALHEQGILRRHKLIILGTPIQAIIDTEDRQRFNARLHGIGLKTARGRVVTSMVDGLTFAKTLGYPVMLRTGFALGGTGSGIAESERTLRLLLANAIAVGSQVILEECLYGWKEVEYEVVRDKEDNCITVCNMENFDPVGIHTGESIVVAPSQTLTDREYFELRDVSIRTIRELGIVGECNIQFALHPTSGDWRIIEVNARLSRSSALASKATGYPLAYIAAKLALGLTLPELRNTVTKRTSAFFEPSLDYVVVKVPRWDLEKYANVDPTIGSEMKSVGEVMAIARTFKEAIQKAVRMLNQGYEGVIDESLMRLPKATIRKRLETPDAKRLFVICAAIARGINVCEISGLTGIDAWYLFSLARIVATYRRLTDEPLKAELLADAKRQGFSDIQIARFGKTTADDVRRLRIKHKITPKVKRIDTMAGEFPAVTNYLYMTYAARSSDHIPTAARKVIVLGSGPYSIGTSVEFDWCAVTTVARLRHHGIKSIMVNCNPETVSTDYDHSDYLYFEELTLERVLDIYNLEKSPFVLSVGGQIPNNLAPKLDRLGIPILGSNAGTIVAAEDRHAFSKLLDRLKIAQPVWEEAHSIQGSVTMAKKIGFPVLLRPSFVLSGRAMLVIENEQQLASYLKHLDLDIRQHPLVITRFLQGATECDFDGVARKGAIIASALSEHVEHGGVHSGDATMVLPPNTLSDALQKKIVRDAKAMVAALSVNGPFNMQFLVHRGKSYVIECNLRASRSFPFVSKALRKNFIDVATDIALGKQVKPVTDTRMPYVAVKVPQFSFKRLRGADPVLRVEMSSTGEVAAFGRDMYEAFLMALLATGMHFPEKKAVFLSLGGLAGKAAFRQGAACLHRLGFTVFATRGTHEFLNDHGIVSQLVGKLHEHMHPNFADLLKEKRVGFSVVLPERFTDNTKTEVVKGETDGYLMRRMSIDLAIPIFTNAQSAYLFVESLERYSMEDLEIRSWNEYN